MQREKLQPAKHYTDSKSASLIPEQGTAAADLLTQIPSNSTDVHTKISNIRRDERNGGSILYGSTKYGPPTSRESTKLSPIPSQDLSAEPLSLWSPSLQGCSNLRVSPPIPSRRDTIILEYLDSMYWILIEQPQG